MGCSAGDFNCNTVTQKVAAVHFVTGIVGVPVVIEFHKAKSILKKEGCCFVLSFSNFDVYFTLVWIRGKVDKQGNYQN